MFPYSPNLYDTDSGPGCDPRGKRGGAYIDCNGSNQYINFTPDASPFDTLQSNTFSCTYSIVIYFRSTSLGFPMNNQIGGSVSRMPYIRYQNSRVGLYNAVDGYVYSTDTIPLNTWVRLTATYNHIEDLQRLYIDDSLQVQINGRQSNDGYKIRNIMSFSNGAFDINGLVSEVQFSNEFLDDQGVSDLVSNPRNLDYSSGYGMCLYFEEDQGSDIYNQSGMDEHGTLQGGASRVNDMSIYSDRDNHGYSEDQGIYYLQDKSQPLLDVLGNNLEFKGPAC